jgi:hypothetical protein
LDSINCRWFGLQNIIRAGIALADYLIGMLENYKKRTMKKFSFQYRGLLFYTGVGKEHSDPNFEYDIHPELKYKYTAKPCKGKPLKIFLK